MIYIHDISSNEYLSRMYFGCLAAYLRDHGHQVSVVQSLDGIKNSTLLIHGDLLSPERILKIKNDGNKLVVFDINDSSYFSSAYQASSEVLLVDLFFKISGIPKTNITEDLSIDRNFNIIASPVQYLPDTQWEVFKQIKDAGKIKSLPYVLWHPLVSPGHPIKPVGERTGRVLIRGGNHFWRFVLFLRLMQQGLDDDRSMFVTADYFKGSMIERFRYCEPCIQEKMQYGKVRYNNDCGIQACKSPVMWSAPGEFFGGPVFGRNDFGNWNNRCIPSFVWLSKEYERCRGPLNAAVLERSLNGRLMPDHEFVQDLSRASYVADLKWCLTILVPPRFWEAASIGTVNFYPERTDDEEYWPPMKKGEHWWPFPNDMSSFELPDEKTWTEISRNAKDLYETCIRGQGPYAVSPNLLQYISEGIESIQ